MSVWILHLPLTPEEESHLHERTHLPLPLGGMPDMTMVGSVFECRTLVQALHPDDPPETVTRRADVLWNLYAGLHPEDIIAVPLPGQQKVALAEITGKYLYQVGVSGTDVHLFPVKWYPRQPELRTFGKHKVMFKADGRAMVEVADKEGRVAIRDKLPFRYNRFAKFKWLPAFFLILAEMAFLARMLHH